MAKLKFSDFLKQLPFMPIFQMSIATTFAGLIFGDWFCTNILKFSNSGRALAWLVALIYSMFLSVLFCYRQFSTKPERNGSSVKLLRHLFLLSPLLIAVALGAGPLISRQFVKTEIILWAGIACWLLFHLIFRKWRIGNQNPD